LTFDSFASRQKERKEIPEIPVLSIQISYNAKTVLPPAHRIRRHRLQLI
jgi:hypothetical protein